MLGNNPETQDGRALGQHDVPVSIRVEPGFVGRGKASLSSGDTLARRPTAKARFSCPVGKTLFARDRGGMREEP